MFQEEPALGQPAGQAHNIPAKTRLEKAFSIAEQSKKW